MEAIELLEDPRTDGGAVAAWVARHGPASVRHERLEAERGGTDVVTVEIGAGAPCLGILGVLGDTGLRPERPMRAPHPEMEHLFYLYPSSYGVRRSRSRGVGWRCPETRL